MNTEFQNAGERCDEPFTPELTRAKNIPSEMVDMWKRWCEGDIKDNDHKSQQRFSIQKPHKRREKTSVEEIKPSGVILWENKTFFLEHNYRYLVFKPKQQSIYKSMYGGKPTQFVVQNGIHIMIPFYANIPRIITFTKIVPASNPMIWLKEQYIDNLRANTKQGRFIKEIWKHREEWQLALPVVG